MSKRNARRFTGHNITYGTTGAQPAPLLTRAPAAATSPPPLGSSNLIRLARPQDLKFLDHLQGKFSNALGFLPFAALEWYTLNRLVGIVSENGEPAGYVLGRERFRYNPELRPITQTAIAMDAQRRHLGMHLVNRVIRRAVDARQLAVQAVCAEDLEANSFWLALGFEKIGAHDAMNRRERKLLVWRKQTTSARPTWFETMPTNPGHRRGARSGSGSGQFTSTALEVNNLTSTPFSDQEISELADVL